MSLETAKTDQTCDTYNDSATKIGITEINEDDKPFGENFILVSQPLKPELMDNGTSRAAESLTADSQVAKCFLSPKENDYLESNESVSERYKTELALEQDKVDLSNSGIASHDQENEEVLDELQFSKQSELAYLDSDKENEQECAGRNGVASDDQENMESISNTGEEKDERSDNDGTITTSTKEDDNDNAEPTHDDFDVADMKKEHITDGKDMATQEQKESGKKKGWSSLWSSAKKKVTIARAFGNKKHKESTTENKAQNKKIPANNIEKTNQNGCEKLTIEANNTDTSGHLVTGESDKDTKEENKSFRGYFTLTYDKTENVWKQLERENTDGCSSLVEEMSVADSGIAESEPSSWNNNFTENNTSEERNADNVGLVSGDDKIGFTDNTNLKYNKESALESGSKPDQGSPNVTTYPFGKSEKDDELSVPDNDRSKLSENAISDFNEKCVESNSADSDATKDQSSQKTNGLSDETTGVDSMTDSRNINDPEHMNQNDIMEKDLVREENKRWTSLWLNAKIKTAIANSFTIWREMDAKTAEAAKLKWKKACTAVEACNKLTPFSECAEEIETVSEKVAKARQRLSSMKHSHRIFQFQAILMLLLLLGLVGITIYKLMDVNHKPQPWNIDHIYIYAYCAAKRMIEQL